LGDELGAYRPRKWRLFRLDAANSSASEIALQEYESAGGFTDFQWGEGYLLISDHEGSLHTGPGEFPQYWADSLASLSLQTGWNLIGTPYNFGIWWDSVLSANDDPALSAYQMKEGNWLVAESLPRQSGLLVWAEEAMELTFPLSKDPCLVSPSPCRRSRPLPASRLDSTSWWVDLLLEQGESRYDAAGIGMSPSATIGYDQHDRIAPPSWEGQPRLTLRAPSRLSYEVVPTASQYRWKFQLTASEGAEPLLLSWHPEFLGETGPSLILFDPQKQRKVDMRTHNRYQLSGTGTHDLEIYFGPEEWIAQIQSTQAALIDFFPNPTRKGGLVSYALPVEMAGQEAEIRILSLQGQLLERITAIPNQTGFHEVRWSGVNLQGQPLPEGIYLYQLWVDGDLIDTRKLMRQD